MAWGVDASAEAKPESVRARAHVARQLSMRAC